ncbi:MAG TPA: membrane protein insertion efficiency factor YidD [Caulobacteraceae bacterium]|nr:membrane protein insertion efficiency factor YidD [Caulobacteraceae bacterium]
MTLYERSVRLAHRAYKLTLSPWIGRSCRFLPTCSDYARDALILHGPVRGGCLAARRLCRCHPFGGSGFDPVPPRSAPNGKQGRSWSCEP